MYTVGLIVIWTYTNKVHTWCLCNCLDTSSLDHTVYIMWHFYNHFLSNQITESHWSTFNRYHRWLLYWRWYCPFIHSCDISESSKGTDRRGGGKFGPLCETGQPWWRGECGSGLSLTVCRQTCGYWFYENSRGFGLSSLTLWSESDEVPWRWVTYEKWTPQ